MAAVSNARLVATSASDDDDLVVIKQSLHADPPKGSQRRGSLLRRLRRALTLRSLQPDDQATPSDSRRMSLAAIAAGPIEKLRSFLLDDLSPSRRASGSSDKTRVGRGNSAGSMLSPDDDEPTASSQRRRSSATTGLPPGEVCYSVSQQLEVPSWWTGDSRFTSTYQNGYVIHGSIDPALALEIARLERKWKWPNSAVFRSDVLPIVLEHAIYNLSPKSMRRSWKPTPPPRSCDRYLDTLRESGWKGYAGKGVQLDEWYQEGDRAFKAWAAASKQHRYDREGCYVVVTDMAYTPRPTAPFAQYSEAFDLRTGEHELYRASEISVQPEYLRAFHVTPGFAQQRRDAEARAVAVARLVNASFDSPPRQPPPALPTTNVSVGDLENDLDASDDEADAFQYSPPATRIAQTPATGVSLQRPVPGGGALLSAAQRLQLHKHRLQAQLLSARGRARPTLSPSAEEEEEEADTLAPLPVFAASSPRASASFSSDISRPSS